MFILYFNSHKAILTWFLIFYFTILGEVGVSHHYLFVSYLQVGPMKTNKTSKKCVALSRDSTTLPGGEKV